MSSPLTNEFTSRRVEMALRAVLPRSVRVHTIHSDSGSDLDINGLQIQTKWLGEGGLRQIRELLAHQRHLHSIVVARHLSPGAREVLSQAGVGWVDETGAAEIAFGSLIISRSGRPAPPPERRLTWTPSVLAVAEAILCGTDATVTATAKVTTLSSGSCTYALRFLTDQHLLVAGRGRGRDSGRRIADEDQLLEAYASSATAKAGDLSLQIGVTWRDLLTGLSEAGKTWDKAGIRWAATGTIAASVIAPYLTSVSTGQVYVSGETIASLESIAAEAKLRPIEGGRLTLLPFPTVTTNLLAKEIQGIHTAPWPRVYADLRTIGVRGEEAAEHLREVLRGR